MWFSSVQFINYEHLKFFVSTHHTIALVSILSLYLYVFFSVLVLGYLWDDVVQIFTLGSVCIEVMWWLRVKSICCNNFHILWLSVLTTTVVFSPILEFPCYNFCFVGCTSVYFSSSALLSWDPILAISTFLPIELEFLNNIFNNYQLDYIYGIIYELYA
jgi:hypothetical protein